MLSLTSSIEELLSVSSIEKYNLKPEEEWPEEVAHLFESTKENNEKKGNATGTL